jgi:endonuclease/exonuclease/phosphatase family metal-dependent hydrolase
MVTSAMVIVWELVRTLYPPGYAMVGDLGFVVTPVLLALIFLAPVLAWPIGRLAASRAWWTAAGLLVTTAVVVQIVQPVLVLAALGVVAGLAGVTVLLALSLADTPLRSAVAVGVTAAIAVDLILKGAFGGWDRVWLSGTRVALGALITGILVVTLVLGCRAAPPVTASVEASNSGVVLAALAVLTMPLTTMFASVAFVGSASGWALASVVLFLGVAASAAVVLAATSTALRARWPVALAGLLGIVAGWALPGASGAVAAAVAAVGLLASGLLIGVLVDRVGSPERAGLRHSAIGACAGWVGAFVLTLLYPMHYEMPLPTGNRVLAPIAVLVASLLTLRVQDLDRREVTTDPTRVGFVAAAGLAATAALVSAGLALAVPSRSDAATASSVTVATFNIDQALTSAGAVDFRAAERAIEAIDADIVALQEVGRGWALSGMNDFVAWYRQRHSERLVWAWAADHQFGNLVISRVSLGEVRRIELPQGDGSMRRSAIIVSVPTPAGDVTVIAVHLQHRNTDGSIAARAAELDVVLAEWAGAPRTIILGDFNADNRRPENGGAKVLEGPGQPNTLQPLLDAGFVTTQPTKVCTTPTSNDNCSDYIFATPDLDLGSGVQILEEQEIGDHRPVRAVVTI